MRMRKSQVERRSQVGRKSHSLMEEESYFGVIVQESPMCGRERVPPKGPKPCRKAFPDKGSLKVEEWSVNRSPSLSSNYWEPWEQGL